MGTLAIFQTEFFKFASANRKRTKNRNSVVSNIGKQPIVCHSAQRNPRAKPSTYIIENHLLIRQIPLRGMTRRGNIITQ
jgi:hypothetical protein